MSTSIRKQQLLRRRVRFEAEVLSTYLDYKETLDWFNKKFLARI
ncbi:MAG: hypothetical protein QW279_15565 [Candidatus Jordarchaeaceae archaeon]